MQARQKSDEKQKNIIQVTCWEKGRAFFKEKIENDLNYYTHFRASGGQCVSMTEVGKSVSCMRTLQIPVYVSCFPKKNNQKQSLKYYVIYPQAFKNIPR